ncbi:hypothetical protein [Streptomyces sp. NPDC058664]|uniref:hypothetical protein n=1 Tax=unclassified Streptomyces TaxID=2593676 RepID=UPI0036596340
MRALDTLEASRAARLREVAAFAVRRRAEKAAGLRVPGGAPVFVPWRPPWPSTTAPSRLGLVAAVADRRAAFLRIPHSDPSLLPDDRARGLADPHGRLDACGAACLTALGRPDDPTRDASAVELADTVAGIRRHVTPGYAPLNVPLPQWLRFAELLACATAFSRTR